MFFIETYDYITIQFTELEIRGHAEDNSKIIFLFHKENVCCDPLLEPSQ